MFEYIFSKTLFFKSFSNQIEAEIAKSSLENAGTKSQLHINDAGGIGNYYTILKIISLLVYQENLIKAHKVLSSFK